jgi:hypothetical protein
VRLVKFINSVLPKSCIVFVLTTPIINHLVPFARAQRGLRTKRFRVTVVLNLMIAFTRNQVNIDSCMHIRFIKSAVKKMLRWTNGHKVVLVRNTNMPQPVLLFHALCKEKGGEIRRKTICDDYPMHLSLESKSHLNGVGKSLAANIWRRDRDINDRLWSGGIIF